MEMVKNIYQQHFKDRPLRMFLISITLYVILISSFGRWQKLTLWDFAFHINYCLMFSFLVIGEHYEKIYLNINDKDTIISTLNSYGYKLTKEKNNKLILKTDQGDWIKGHKKVTIKETSKYLEVNLPKSPSKDLVGEFVRVF